MSRSLLIVLPCPPRAVLRLSHVVGGMCPVCGLRLHSASAMNDKCLDLQRKKSKTRPGCPYLSRAPKTPHERREASNEDDPAPSGPNVVRISGRKRKTSAPSHTPSSRGPDLTQLRNYALKTPMDLEDLHTLGQFLHTCPYYASRRAVRAAHLVAAPYASLFHSGTRESLGLNLRGAVVVVDEAHNLIETLNDLHSPNLSLSVLDQAKEHLQLYLDRYEERLESRQLKLMFKQLTTLIDALLSSLRPTPPSGEQTEGEGSQQSSPPAGASSLVLGITDFLFQSGLDNVNLFHILRFIEETQLSKKLIGFRDQVIQLRQEAELRDEAKQGPDAAQDGEETSEYEFRQMSPLQPMVSFLQAVSIFVPVDGRTCLDQFESNSVPSLSPFFIAVALECRQRRPSRGRVRRERFQVCLFSLNLNQSSSGIPSSEFMTFLNSPIVTGSSSSCCAHRYTSGSSWSKPEQCSCLEGRCSLSVISRPNCSATFLQRISWNSPVTMSWIRRMSWRSP